MKARLLRLLRAVADAFWVLPAAIILLLAGLALLVVEAQDLDALPSWAPQGWIYGGGDTGARTLLGAIASSTIGVAGTVFSITIAALTLASSQMGPRLLGAFMRDRGNQLTLGVLLGTFGYCLLVLRSVRGGEDEAFVPALGVTVGLGLAGACTGLLIWFIHHVASRMNVGVVIDLVYRDLLAHMRRLAPESPAPVPADPIDWTVATPVAARRSGYLQQLDADSLVRWAHDRDCVVRLLRRPGQFVMAGAPVALVCGQADGADDAVWQAIALSGQSGSPADLTFPVGQLVEVAVRALSPGVNDPRTAISVLDHLGAALAWLVPRHLDRDVRERDGVVRVRLHPLGYAELADAMFDLIRENAGGSPSVLLHMLAILTGVAGVEPCSARREILRRKGREVHDEGQAAFVNPCDRDALAAHWRDFLAAAADGDQNRRDRDTNTTRPRGSATMGS